MADVHMVDHPLVKAKLTTMRDRRTHSAEFRKLLKDITLLMGYEVTRDLPLETAHVKTPLCSGEFPVLASHAVTIVPVLRAGLGMVDGFLELMPFARIGHIGLARNEQTHLPEEYYCKLPADCEESLVLVVDPMLATGGSASNAIASLKSRNVSRIKLVNLVATPQGIEAVHRAHPDVEIFTAAIDEGLNDQAYIVPGLGDAGDRIFNTL